MDEDDSRPRRRLNIDLDSILLDELSVAILKDLRNASPKSIREISEDLGVPYSEVLEKIDNLHRYRPFIKFLKMNSVGEYSLDDDGERYLMNIGKQRRAGTLRRLYRNFINRLKYYSNPEANVWENYST